MLKVLITGGSGFIGTNLVESLLADNISVMNIDKAPPVVDSHTPFWREIDILSYSKLEEAILGFDPDIIVHLAAVTDLNGNDLAYYSANIQGTSNIIKVASKLRSLKKVIYTSSMYICQPGFIPSDYNTYRPHTKYGESKMEGELLVKAIKEPGYEWVIVRPTSIWGPWFKVPYIDFFNIVYSGKYFDFGRTCTKTYGYVGNTVFQLKKLMMAEGVHKRTFYLGDDPAIQISEWANEISLSMGKGKIKKVPFGLIKSVALTGDLLSAFRFKFPMTSFRLSNMTTNNVLPLKDIYDIAGEPPFQRHEGVLTTIDWLKSHKGYKINLKSRPVVAVAETVS